jgi:hypothetical protein
LSVAAAGSLMIGGCFFVEQRSDERRGRPDRHVDGREGTWNEAPRLRDNGYLSLAMLNLHPAEPRAVPNTNSM